MTESDMKKMLKAMTEESDEAVLSTYLHLAGDTIVRKAFPYGDGNESVPAKYKSLQVEIAAYLLNKRGAEGETSHDENGIRRQYENGDVPASLLSAITPYCGVIG